MFFYYSALISRECVRAVVRNKGEQKEVSVPQVVQRFMVGMRVTEAAEIAGIFARDSANVTTIVDFTGS